MNWIDYTFVGFIAIGTIFGILTGPLWQIYRIFSIALSVVAALLFHTVLSGVLNGTFSPEISNILGYTIIFVVVFILTYVVGNLFGVFLKKRKFGVGGRILGGVFALIKTVLACCIIISGILITGNDRAGEMVNSSLIGNNLNKGVKVVITTIPQNLRKVSFVETKTNLKK